MGEIPVTIMSGQYLLVSAFDDELDRGGIFSFDGERLEQLDDLPCTGLAWDGARLVRALRSKSEAGSLGELLVYDAQGVRSYLRVDELADPHDLLWDGDGFIAVSPAKNSVLWLTSSGVVRRTWRAPGADESWHLNCVTRTPAGLFASAFGRFSEHRMWDGPGADGAGFVFNIETGEDVAGGLKRPHHPRFVDGRWYVCDSGCGDLAEIGEDGTVYRRVELGGWTRGLAVSEEFFFVGVSASRRAEADCGVSNEHSSEVAVVSRRDWSVTARLPIPCREIYEVVVVPPEAVASVRRGFRTNPSRVAATGIADLFHFRTPERVVWPDQPVATNECRVSINAIVSRRLPSNDRVEVPYSVTNNGRAVLGSGGVNPVMVSYRWFPEDHLGEAIDGIRNSLPGLLFPGASVNGTLVVHTPSRRGRWRLRVSLVQEQIAWFDDLDSDNGIERVVEVLPASDRGWFGRGARRRLAKARP